MRPAVADNCAGWLAPEMHQQRFQAHFEHIAEREAAALRLIVPRRARCARAIGSQIGTGEALSLESGVHNIIHPLHLILLEIQRLNPGRASLLHRT